MIVSDEYQEWLRDHLLGAKLVGLAFPLNRRFLPDTEQHDASDNVVLKFQQPNGDMVELEVWRPATIIYRGGAEGPS